MAQEALVAAAVWMVFTVIAVLSIAVTWKLAGRAARIESERKAAEARKDAGAASERWRASLKQTVP